MFPCVFFKHSDGSLESNTLSIASLDLASQGSLCLFLQGCALAHPSSLPWFLGSQALLPLAGSRCVSSGLREVPPGEVPRSLFWCHSTVKALHLPPFQGGPMGPAVTLADHSTLKNLHQRQGAWAWNRLSAPAAPSLPFPPLPAPQFPEGLNTLTPKEKPCRAETSL